MKDCVQWNLVYRFKDSASIGIQTFNGKLSRPGREIIKIFPCSIQLSMKFFLLINVKMPIVGILTFTIRKNSIPGLSELKNTDFLDIFMLMSIYNFMLS